MKDMSGALQRQGAGEQVASVGAGKAHNLHAQCFQPRGEPAADKTSLPGHDNAAGEVLF